MSGASLVTGATGFLGRRLVRALLLRGERVVALVRAADEAEARRRMLESTGAGFDHRALAALPADLPDRLPLSRIVSLGPYEHVWHLAALVDLGTRKRRALHESNVLGTARVLEHARTFLRGRFHHLSTAYRCGLAGGTVYEETHLPAPSYRNEYERTKEEAERLVRAAMAGGMAATLYRPSIVVGESRTGATDVYGAFYQVVRTCLAARGLGPLVLPGDPKAPLDLVPVDGVVDALLRLSLRPDAVGRTFHLTSPRPPTLQDLVDVANERGWSWVDAVRDAPPESLPWPTPAVMRHARAMLPYLRGAPRFDRSNTDRCLGPGSLAFEGTSRESLVRLVGYAIENGFGVDAETARRERKILDRRSVQCGERVGVGRT